MLCFYDTFYTLSFVKQNRFKNVSYEKKKSFLFQSVIIRTVIHNYHDHDFFQNEVIFYLNFI